MTGISKSIIEHQKADPINLEMPVDHLEKRSRQEGFNPLPATGAYS